MTNKTFFLLFTVSVLLLSSCKKKENGPELGNSTVFTVNFTDHYIQDDLGAVVYVTNRAGQLVADTLCTENRTYQLLSKIPGNGPYTVTIAQYRLYWHSLLVRISSYSEVSAREWTVKGFDPDTIGHANFDFINVPALSGPLLYSTLGQSNLTFSTTQQHCGVYKTPDLFLVSARTNGNLPIFKYLENIQPGVTYTVDMSTAGSAETKNIPLNLTSQNWEGLLWGYTDADYDSPLALQCDHIFSDGSPVTSINVSYPPGKFTGFRTKIILQDDVLSPNTYTSNTYGPVAAQFEKINAGILSMQPANDHVNIQASGQFNVIAAQWRFIDHQNRIFEWTLYAPDTTLNLSLPVISPMLAATFPSLQYDSLSFDHAELLDLKEVTGYTQFLDMLFNPAHPSRLERLEGSTVIRQ